MKAGGTLTPTILGGARRDRTADLYNAIVALSQLSYGPEAMGGELYVTLPTLSSALTSTFNVPQCSLDPGYASLLTNQLKREVNGRGEASTTHSDP